MTKTNKQKNKQTKKTSWDNETSQFLCRKSTHMCKLCGFFFFRSRYSKIFLVLDMCPKKITEKWRNPLKNLLWLCLQDKKRNFTHSADLSNQKTDREAMYYLESIVQESSIKTNSKISRTLRSLLLYLHSLELPNRC